MLKLLTNSKASTLKEVTGPVLDAAGVAYQGIAWDPWELYVPAAGEIILAMGSKAVDQLREAKVLPGNLSIDKMRGQLWEAGGGKGAWMVTYDPFMPKREPSFLAKIQWDVHLATRYLKTGSLEPNVGAYRYVENFDDIVQQVVDHWGQTGEPLRLHEDLETLGLWPWYDDAWIVSIAFTPGDGGTGDMLVLPNPGDRPSGYVLDQVLWLESTERVSLGGSNLKFDNVWKAVQWSLPLPTNFNFDTILVGSLLDENRSNSLNTHAKVYTDMGGYDDAFNRGNDKARMDLAYAKDPDDYLLYGCGDTDSGARTRARMVPLLLEDQQLTDFYTTILHPAARAFEKIELRGLVVDAPQLRAVGMDAAQDVEDAERDLVRMTPPAICRKHAERLKFTPKVIQEIFFGPRGWGLKPTVATEKAPKGALDEGLWEYASTSVDEHLKTFKDHPEAGPFITRLRARNRAHKVRSSFVDSWLKDLRPDGRFHSTFQLHVGSMFDKGDESDDSGAVTGRLAVKNPAGQTLVKKTKPGTKNWAKPLRLCYPAPPGMVMFENDYSQGELKIAACYSTDETMLEAFRQGQDLHLLTGCEVNGMTYEDGLRLMASDDPADNAQVGDIRYGAKAVNFGKIFGQSPKGFVDYAFKQWDLEYTMEESVEIDRLYFGKYKMLRAWHTAYIEHAKEHGQVANPFGRIRHLPLIHSKDQFLRGRAGRQAINSPVQSTLSDMCLWSIVIAEFEEELDKQGLQIVLQVHDAIIGYAPDTSAGLDLIRRLAWIMGNLPITEFCGWEPQLKFPADATVGPNWAELENLPLAA